MRLRRPRPVVKLESGHVRKRTVYGHVNVFSCPMYFDHLSTQSEPLCTMLNGGKKNFSRII